MNASFSDFVESAIQPKPFVKWVGGKRSIIKELWQKIPRHINNYYEPFVGGGALFFEIYNIVNHSYLSDINVDLVVSYNIIKNEPQKLIKLLTKYQENHNKKHYYKIRSMQELQDPIENSSSFIYLMKTCFNGLYRVNKKQRIQYSNWKL